MYRETRIAIKHLLGLLLRLIKDIPVVYRCIRDKTERIDTNPFPKSNVFMELCRLDLLSLAQVKNLQCPSLCLQSNNVSMPVHDSTVCFNRSTNNLIVVPEVDDIDLWLCIRIIAGFLSYADKVIGFEGLGEVRNFPNPSAIWDTYTRIKPNGSLLRRRSVGNGLLGWHETYVNADVLKLQAGELAVTSYHSPEQMVNALLEVSQRILWASRCWP